MLSFRSISILLVSFDVALCYNSFHIVDLQQIICPGEPGFFDIQFNSDELINQRNLPHIVTFLRSTGEVTNVTYELRDGNGAVVNGGSESLSLALVEQARRLNEPKFRDSNADFDIDSQSRRLSSRRRTISIPPRRRIISIPPRRRIISIPPRRRVSPPRRRVSNPRRRSSLPNSPAARRRGSDTISSGARRRATAVLPPGAPANHGRFQTAGGSGYGYTSSAAMQQNYGGQFPVASPNYGYAGTSSFGPGKPSTFAPVAAGFLGGAVAGAGSFYMLSLLSRSTCIGFSCCFGCSNSCYSSFNSNCDVYLRRDLIRDDIMKSGLGFYPGDFSFPLSIRILNVSGSGYKPEDICPPSSVGTNSTDESLANVTTNGSSIQPNSLFVTLTVMSELGDIDSDSEDLISKAWHGKICLQITAAPLVIMLLHALSRLK